MAKKVVLYSTSWCPWCKKVREFFNENKISFTDKDVEKFKKYADEMVKKSKQKGIPVIDIGGKIIVGYKPEEMKKALRGK